MRYILGAAFAAAAFVSSANAAVISLENVFAVDGGYQFDYRASLNPDEGLAAGDSFTIFDFAGYVDGSAFASEYWSITAANVGGVLITPGASDSASLINLTFTYNGPDLNLEPGPLDAIFFNGFGAVSVYGSTVADAFTTYTTRNNPVETAGTTLIQAGLVQVPGVPEPATWAMMIAGFGLVGASMRRNRHVLGQVSC